MQGHHNPAGQGIASEENADLQHHVAEALEDVDEAGWPKGE